MTKDLRLLLCFLLAVLVVGRQPSSWSRFSSSPSFLARREPLPIHLILRGGSGVAPVLDGLEEIDETADDKLAATSVSPLGFLKDLTVWYYQASKRAVVTAVEEFQRPVHSQGGQSSFVVCCLVRTKRMVVGGTVAFWKTENRAKVGGEAKEVASRILRWSKGKLKSIRTSRESSQARALEEEEDEAVDQEDVVDNEDDYELQQVHEMQEAPSETILKADTEERITEENEETPIEATNSTTTTAAPAPAPAQRDALATSPKKTESKVVKVANIVNRISSFCIIAAFVGIAGMKAWELTDGVGVVALLEAGKTMISNAKAWLQSMVSKIQSKKEGEKQKQE